MAYYRVTSDNSQQLNDRYLDVFSDFDFKDIEITCDFFCPECRQLSSCETYTEIKGEWEFLYM